MPPAAAPPRPPAPAAPAKASPGIPQPVGKARTKPRHYGILATFIAVVIVPTLVSGLYLFTIAKDQYVSQVGFAIRSESQLSALGLLGGLSSLTGSSSSDANVLYQFIRSQDLVAAVDAKLDLRRIYAPPGFDPFFTFDTRGSIEDLTDYWRRMVRVDYDSGTGLIEIRVNAFDPEDARRVAREIFDDSADLINRLSAIARDDATRYAKQELDESLAKLADARVALSEFRSRTQIVDPTAAVQGQLGLLNQLNQQKAQALIELKLLRETVRDSDPRIVQAERRIAVIDEMVAQEKRKFGLGGEDPDTAAQTPGNDDYSALVGDYERLAVDQQFAEKAYLAALTAYDAARAEAQRKSRYLAAYVQPTLAESSTHPRRATLTALVGSFGLLFWLIGVLIYYSVRDRR